jgi:Zn-finger nucleic acid-binding protein
MAGAAACTFCGSDFTIHEMDLDTICPRCMSRIGRAARFCHSCAAPILVAGSAGEATVHPCPICGGGQPLASRRLGASDLPALECGRCAGLWLDSEAFRLLAERARTETLPIEGHGAPASRAVRTLAEQAGPAYRSCPICGALMHRQNYGRRSGVILDICKEHGVWFDAQELEEVLDWVRRGGSEVVARIEHEEQLEAERQQRLRKLAEPTEVGGWEYERSRPTFLNLLAEIASHFL